MPFGASIRLGDLIPANADMLKKRNGKSTPKAMSSEVIKPGVRSWYRFRIPLAGAFLGFFVAAGFAASRDAAALGSF
jgi:hypothetical protein